MTDIPASLAARVEALTGPDREVDALITVALRLGCTPNLPDDLQYLTMPHKSDQCAAGTYWYHRRSGMSLRTAEPLTASLDCALALSERVRPDVYVKIDQYMNTGAVKYAWAKWRVWLKTYEPLGEWFGGPSSTPALALLAALLASMDTPS